MVTSGSSSVLSHLYPSSRPYSPASQTQAYGGVPVPAGNQQTYGGDGYCTDPFARVGTPGSSPVMPPGSPLRGKPVYTGAEPFAILTKSPGGVSNLTVTPELFCSTLALSGKSIADALQQLVTIVGGVVSGQVELYTGSIGSDGSLTFTPQGVSRANENSGSLARAAVSAGPGSNLLQQLLELLAPQVSDYLAYGQTSYEAKINDPAVIAATRELTGEDPRAGKTYAETRQVNSQLRSGLQLVAQQIELNEEVRSSSTIDPTDVLANLAGNQEPEENIEEEA